MRVQINRSNRGRRCATKGEDLFEDFLVILQNSKTIGLPHYPQLPRICQSFSFKMWVGFQTPKQRKEKREERRES